MTPNTGVPTASYNANINLSTPVAANPVPPVTGSPILSMWKWDSGKGALKAEITTPSGVVVIMNSSAPSLAGLSVSNVELIDCSTTRMMAGAYDKYDFKIKIIMQNGDIHTTAGVAKLSDTERERMSKDPSYITQPLYKKPVDRSKYIRWMCEHIIANESLKFCDECKVQYK